MTTLSGRDAGGYLEPAGGTLRRRRETAAPMNPRAINPKEAGSGTD